MLRPRSCCQPQCNPGFFSSAAPTWFLAQFAVDDSSHAARSADRRGQTQRPPTSQADVRRDEPTQVLCKAPIATGGNPPQAPKWVWE